MLATGDAVRERERCGRDDEVQRKEKKGVFCSQPNGDPERSGAEEQNRNDRRVPDERNGHCKRREGASDHEREAGRLGEEKAEVVVADE